MKIKLHDSTIVWSTLPPFQSSNQKLSSEDSKLHDSHVFGVLSAKFDNPNKWNKIFFRHFFKLVLYNFHVYELCHIGK